MGDTNDTTPPKSSKPSAVREALNTISSKLFGSGAAAKAADALSTRAAQIEAAEKAATGYRKGGHVHTHKRMPSTMKRTQGR